MSQITTITFLKYKTILDKAWAFGMMQFAHKRLLTVNGLEAYKLMGSGKNGFSPLPDWSVYALLQVWEDEKAANLFFENSGLMKDYRAKSSEYFILYMKNIKSHGKWSGKNPFMKSNTLNSENPFVAVITRATIKKRLLLKFWRYVPTSQKPLKTNEGLIYTKGIGEVPFLQMATFSLWKDMDSLIHFAYNTSEHKRAVTDTKKIKWYKEELFSRFQPYRSEGTWSDIETLPF